MKQNNNYQEKRYKEYLKERKLLYVGMGKNTGLQDKCVLAFYIPYIMVVMIYNLMSHGWILELSTLLFTIAFLIVFISTYTGARAFQFAMDELNKKQLDSEYEIKYSVCYKINNYLNIATQVAFVSGVISLLYSIWR